MFTTTYALLFVSAAILFCLSSLSSAASTTDTTSSDVPSSQHEVHILHRRRRLNSKTSKALLFSKTSKAYDSSSNQLSGTPAAATQDTPTSSINNYGLTNYYHPNINKRFFMFSKGGKMFKSTKTLKQNHTSNKQSSTIDTSFPKYTAASLSMSYDMSMSFDNDGNDFFFLPDDVIQEFGRVVSKRGKSSKSVSKSKTSKL